MTRRDRSPDKSGNSTATAAGVHGAVPLRRAPHANRRRPIAAPGHQRTDWGSGSTFVLPLPLVADADGWIWMGNKGYACRHSTPPLPSGTDPTPAAHFTTGL